MTDQDLARAFVNGDGAAIRIVDGLLSASLGPFRRRLAGAWEDVAQDARLELINRLRAGEFRGVAGLRTYVWRVATHAAISRLRRDTVRQTAPLDLAPAPAAADPSALDRLLKAEADDLVIRVLAEVDPPCRDLWRALIAGRSYADVSAETGVSEGALRVRALRCRQAAVVLRDRLIAEAAETTASEKRPS